MPTSARQPAPHNLSLGKESKESIALVCDWLTTPGGAEKVLLELHRMYPQAPIYTSQYSKKGINWFDDADVRTGWLQIFPRGLRKFLGPLRQLYFSHLDLSSYDVVISVTGAEAKAVRTKLKAKKNDKKKKKDILSSETALFDDKTNRSLEVGHLSPRKGSTHVCFCHVPTQYYWQMYDQYLENPGFGFLNPLVRFVFRFLVKPLRQADYRAAQQPDQFVTISHYAQDQIQRYYHREAKIVAPPVEIDKFMPKSQNSASKPDFSTTQPEKSTKTANFSTRNPQPTAKLSTKSASFSTESQKFSTKNSDLSTEHPQVSTTRPKYYIIACRQATWKRVDLAIEACKKLHLPLKVVGDGSEHQRLVQLAAADPNIEFIPWADTRELAKLLQHATAYIFPSLEPFGVAAVEALAAGCPVIALSQGGSQDFIIDRVNGLLFPEQTVASLVQALQDFQRLHFDRTKVSQTAQPFAVSHFRQSITDLVARATPHGKLNRDQSDCTVTRTTHKRAAQNRKDLHENT